MTYFVEYTDGIMGDRCLSLAEAAREGMNPEWADPDAHIIYDPGDPADRIDEGTVAEVFEQLGLEHEP